MFVTATKALHQTAFWFVYISSKRVGCHNYHVNEETSAVMHKAELIIYNTT